MTNKQYDPSNPLHDFVNPVAGEDGEAFKAFLIYRNFPGKRSVRNAYRSVSGHEQAQYAPGNWTRWFREFNWEARALGWDGVRSRETSSEMIKTEKEVTSINFAGKFLTSRVADYTSAQRIRSLVDKRLTVLETNPRAKFSAYELESLNRIVKGASDLERRAIGVDDKPLAPEEEAEVKRLAKCTPEELVERRTKAMKRLRALGMNVLDGNGEQQ